MGLDTIPNVFIIESNSWENETQGIREGQMLRDLLKMLNKTVKYRYIRTEKELEVVAHQFARSQYRYLHIASHGEKGKFHLTLDAISYRRFAELMGPHLTGRRLFVSACSVVRGALAREIFRVSHPFSITGPRADIAFSDSAAVWVSLYSLLFKKDPDAMSSKEVIRYLKELCRIHEVQFGYYWKTKNPPSIRFIKC